MQNLGDALLLHGDAVKDVRGFHGTSSVGNDDELRLLAEISQITGKPLHISVVQSCINLFQKAEGRRAHLQDRKVKRNGHEGLFTAGQQSDGFDLLAGGLNFYLNAAGQRRLRVLQDQLALAAAEHFHKGLLEMRINFGEFPDKYLRHLLSDALDNALQLLFGVEHIIQNITQEMTEIFVREFSKINEHFQQTFVEMFGGGKGELVLEDPDEPLTCGIEIKVQPPGKQVKTITLLSGGEKAFVAIALYFAILKVRPTPFCLLDEIDAALDDRNVERFATYLHTLCQKTQFIVITHRRGTMEASDVLYGVTMQEQGISKILHLDLNQMTRELGITE